MDSTNAYIDAIGQRLETIYMGILGATFALFCYFVVTGAVRWPIEVATDIAAVSTGLEKPTIAVAHLSACRLLWGIVWDAAVSTG